MGFVHLAKTSLQQLAEAGFIIDPEAVSAEESDYGEDIVATDRAGGVLLLDPEWQVSAALDQSGLPGDAVGVALAETTGCYRLSVRDQRGVRFVGEGETDAQQVSDPGLLAELTAGPQPVGATADRYLGWFESLTGADPYDENYEAEVWHRVQWPGMPTGDGPIGW